MPVQGCQYKRTVELMCDNMSSFSLVKECKELEKVCGVAYRTYWKEICHGAGR